MDSISMKTVRSRLAARQTLVTHGCSLGADMAILLDCSSYDVFSAGDVVRCKFASGISFDVSSCNVRPETNMVLSRPTQAILSMPFFDQDAWMGTVGYLWVWVVLTVPTTVVAAMIYVIFTKRGLKKESDAQGQEEEDADLSSVNFDLEP